MSLEEKLLAIYTAATVVQVAIVALSLLFLYRQAVAARKSVENLETTARLNAYLNHRRLLTEINNLVVNHQDLLQEIGYERRDILAFMFIGYAEAVFLQSQYQLVEEHVWQSHRVLVRKFMDMPFVANVWAATKHEFLPSFVQFVDSSPKATPK